MPNKKNQQKNIKRNAFVALCDHASRNNWCWNLFCTTCGHGSFSVALSKIAHGLHPDDESFWPHGKENHSLLKESEQYGDFWRNSNPPPTIQGKLASIVADAKISDIQAVAKYPDWLGYIGLVVNHCPNREPRGVISESLLPQFIDMLKNNREICEYLNGKQSRHELLSINDLSRIESRSVDSGNLPLPLIFDVL